MRHMDGNWKHFRGITVIIVDGIDACERNERKMIFRFFASATDQSNVEPGNLRCLFISPELDDMKVALGTTGSLQLKGQPTMSDIREYASYHSIRI